MNQELEGDWPQVDPDQLPQVYLQCLFELIFNLSQLAGDDGDVELQGVIEQQLLAGQGDHQLTTQEFEQRFFLQNP